MEDILNCIKKNDDLKIVYGLVNVLSIDASLVIDMKYATEDNFMKRNLYPLSICVLQLSTAKKLAIANLKAKEYGYRLKVYDAYRPLSVQKLMWDIIQNDDFVADPSTGSIHNKGAAVDVTFVNKSGNEIRMPSVFDEFSEKSWINFQNASPDTIYNRELLAKVMVDSGFSRIESEWWHFNDTDHLNYPVLDIGLEEFY